MALALRLQLSYKAFTLSSVTLPGCCECSLPRRPVPLATFAPCRPLSSRDKSPSSRTALLPEPELASPLQLVLDVPRRRISCFSSGSRAGVFICLFRWLPNFRYHPELEPKRQEKARRERVKGKLPSATAKGEGERLKVRSREASSRWIEEALSPLRSSACYTSWSFSLPLLLLPVSPLGGHRQQNSKALPLAPAPSRKGRPSPSPPLAFVRRFYSVVSCLYRPSLSSAWLRAEAEQRRRERIDLLSTTL